MKLTESQKLEKRIIRQKINLNRIKRELLNYEKVKIELNFNQPKEFHKIIEKRIKKLNRRFLKLELKIGDLKYLLLNLKNEKELTNGN